MIKYNQGKIYRIVPNCEHEPHEQYIGSTVKGFLSQRLATHRCDYKKYLLGLRGNITSFKLFEKYGMENCIIVLVENVNANSKEELCKREREIIESTACVNKQIPTRTLKGYYQDNIDHITKRNKEYQMRRLSTSPKIQCLCGSIYKECYTWHHLRCKKHLAFINM